MQSLAMQTQASPRRRFTDLKEIAPRQVMRLAESHPAIVGAQTLFPSRVFTADQVPRILISGVNHRKLGDRVTKGPWRGMPIFALTLEERATCPDTCHHWRSCYGNGMQYARRVDHGDGLMEAIERDLEQLQKAHPSGFVVRLHILGDFYSVGYAKEWMVWLDQFPALHVFGYTAHRPDSDIGILVCWMGDRWHIRHSSTEAGPERACTLWEVPEKQPKDGIICPAQTGRTECCGSCGLCWSAAAKDKTIYFLAHGSRLQGKPAGEPMPSVSIREFFAAAGSKFTKADAAVIGPQLQEIASEGKASAAAILDVAKSSNSPLHRYFEWNDSLAANYYRLGQAEEMSRSIRIRLVSGDETPANEPVRVRVASDPPPRVPMQRHIGLLDDKSDEAAQRAQQAYTALDLWQERYGQYALTWKRFKYVFGPVIEEIDRALDRLHEIRRGNLTEETAPEPAPLKIGPLPEPKKDSPFNGIRIAQRASVLAEPEFTAAPSGAPAAMRAMRELGEKRGVPAMFQQGSYIVGKNRYTAEEVIAAAKRP